MAQGKEKNNKISPQTEPVVCSSDSRLKTVKGGKERPNGIFQKYFLAAQKFHFTEGPVHTSVYRFFPLSVLLKVSLK